MDITAIKVATLKAVLKDGIQPKWPAGCTQETVNELLTEGLLEHKTKTFELKAGWSSLPTAGPTHGEYHVTPLGKQFIRACFLIHNHAKV